MCSLFKLAMFVTSFIPLWITIIFIDVMSIINNNRNLISEYIGITIMMLSMKEIENSVDFTTFRILEAVQEKGITSEFLLSYILPLFTFDFTRWFSIVQFLIYFVILAFLCVRNNNVYANLIFEAIGYRFYTCDLQWEAECSAKPIQCVVLSRQNLTAERGNTIKIVSLNKPFYLMINSSD